MDEKMEIRVLWSSGLYLSLKHRHTNTYLCKNLLGCVSIYGLQVFFLCRILIEKKKLLLVFLDISISIA